MSNSNQQRISELLDAGCNQDQAALFAPTPLTTQEVLEFVANGLGPDHIHFARTFSVSPSDLRKWLDLLFLQTYVGQVLKLEISLDDATRIFQGKVDPERSTIITLLEQGTTVDEILLLKELGIYFFRTIATKRRPLRDVFLDEIFGSKKVREVWQLTGATTREAAYAHKSGLSPLQFVEGKSVGTTSPLAQWILEQKRYDFGSYPIPDVFLESLGNNKNEAFLRAVGYDTKVRSLKKEFIARTNPTLVFYTNSRKGENAVIAFSRNEDKWNSRFLVNGFEENSLEAEGNLLDLGNHAIEIVESHGLGIKEVKVLPNLKALNSELLLALGSCFSHYPKQKLPTINSKEARQYKTIVGGDVFAPLIEIDKRPGFERIDRVGDVAFYSLGAAPAPLVGVVEGSDADIRVFFAEAIAQLPSEVFDAINIERVFLLAEEEIEHEPEELQDCLYSHSTDEIVVGCNWLVQIWINEERISVDEVLERIQIIDDDEYEFESSKWELVSNLCDFWDLPTWHRFDDFFLRRPPIFINGRGYAVPRDHRNLLLEIDPNEECGLPRIERPIASYSISELNSMVSGTDWHYFGFARAHLLVGIELLDERETEVCLWSVKNDDWTKYFAEWLLHDIYGFNIKARYWIESVIGQLPDVEELSADWFDEKLSSTLMVYFGCTTHTKEFNEAVLARLIREKEIAVYTESIREPHSERGKTRIERHRLFNLRRGLHVKVGTDDSC